MRWGLVSSAMLQVKGQEKNGLKLHQERQRLDNRFFFFTPPEWLGTGVSLPREVMKSPCLEMFKKHRKVALGDVV